jgi:hypothetical protein
MRHHSPAGRGQQHAARKQDAHGNDRRVHDAVQRRADIARQRVPATHTLAADSAQVAQRVDHSAVGSSPGGLRDEQCDQVLNRTRDPHDRAASDLRPPRAHAPLSSLSGRMAETGLFVARRDAHDQRRQASAMPVALAPADVTLQKRGGRSHHPLGSRTRPGMRQRPGRGSDRSVASIDQTGHECAHRVGIERFAGLQKTTAEDQVIPLGG